MPSHPYFMVSNRKMKAGGLGREIGTLRYFEAPSTSKPAQFASWKELSAGAFKKRLEGIAQNFPVITDDWQNAQQRHVSLFVHGYNNEWDEAAKRYAQIKRDLFDTNDLGVLILYTWPSNGSVAGYLADREDARKSSEDVTTLLVGLHDHLTGMQQLAVKTQDPTKFCRAKVSGIAHSMGCYVLQNGLAMAAKRLNSPQLVTLLHQVVLVAADIDNDIFNCNKPDDSDGSLMANLSYRIGALYTGLDDTLGASAGLKHFGTRRLGRSGLPKDAEVWDNVFDYDVSSLISHKGNIHSAVFESTRSMQLVERILRGVDRAHLSAAA